MRKQKTLGKLKLAERSIYRGWVEKNPCEHVRAELDRLARQIRKLYHKRVDTSFLHGQNTTINIILRYIREAKR